MFAQALRHHQARDWNAAERLYRQVLAANPSHADSLHLLGVIAYQSGHDEAAIGLIGQAVAIHAGEASYHSNLGNALYRQGRLDAAAACFAKAIALRPDLREPRNNLGIALMDRGRLEEAGACFQAALALKPDDPASHVNLGNALRQQGRLDEAAARFAPRHRPAARLPGCPHQPRHGPHGTGTAGRSHPLPATRDQPRSGLSRGLQQSRERLAAAGTAARGGRMLRQAITLKPDYPEAHSNLGDGAAGAGGHGRRMGAL